MHWRVWCCGLVFIFFFKLNQLLHFLPSHVSILTVRVLHVALPLCSRDLGADKKERIAQNVKPWSPTLICLKSGVSHWNCGDNGSHTALCSQTQPALPWLLFPRDYLLSSPLISWDNRENKSHEIRCFSALLLQIRESRAEKKRLLPKEHD